MELKTTIERNRLIKIFSHFLVDIFLRFTRSICSWHFYSSNTVAIISIHKLGDTVSTIPAVREILKYFSNKENVIICFSETQAIYRRAFPDLDIELIEHNEFRFEGRIAKKSARSKVKKYKPNIIIDLTGSISSASLIYLIRAAEILGINIDYFKSLYNIYSPIRKTPHIMDIYLDAIAPKIKIQNSIDIKTFPAKLIRNNARLLFHPSAGWESKKWGTDNFVELILQLSEYERTIIIEEPYYDNSVIDILLNNGVNVVESKTVERLMEIIESHAVFIGNDSGPAHISAFLGIPTFIIYGPTNPGFHIPEGKYHQYIQKNIWCSPKMNEKLCYTDGGRNGCPSYECMKQLSVNEVKKKLLCFLDEIEIKQSS